MNSFQKRYSRLNKAQKAAVDEIEGPLLVIAGPGTGKTELLSVRVANILKKTDSLPSNILCLTFTESGARNMQDRLQSLIGRDAYDVTISTYHAFGSEVLSRSSDYIDDRLETPIESLRQYQIIEDIVRKLSWRDPLKQTQYHLRDLISTISEIKRALLTPDDLRSIAKENQQTFEATNHDISNVFADLKRMPGKIEKAMPYFIQTLDVLKSVKPARPHLPIYGSLAEVAIGDLQSAIDEAEAQQSSKPLTAWKNKWLAKNTENQFVLEGELANQRLNSLASVIESYQTELSSRGWFDFDDMILRAIKVLEQHDDLKYSLQEKYLYILLDEYQDTNAAQSRLVELLSDNPVHEGRPNIMAVGDDDQAIYAFQGAQYSNMYDFHTRYRDTKVISLNENYRSHEDILYFAKGIANQISERLHTKFGIAAKELIASNPHITSCKIARQEFKSPIAEYDFVAKNIRRLIDQGVSPNEIAVLTPKHSILEGFVSYALNESLAVSYEKRENILDSDFIQQILQLTKLVHYTATNNRDTDSLWPEILSYPYFAIPVHDIWKISWKTRDEKSSWMEQLLVSENSQLRSIAIWISSLALRINNESAETIIDYLIGLREVAINDPAIDSFQSPIMTQLKSQSESAYFEAMSSLTVLRARLNDYYQNKASSIKINDLIDMVESYRTAGERMLNTSPYHQSDNSVSLMTAFKAKGLEFEYVFLLSVTDETWGGSGQSQSNKLTLPANLAPTRHGGASDDERLRLLFVALTRAKTHLILTSSSSNYSSKSTTRLRYLDERTDESDYITSPLIPSSQNKTLIQDDNEPPPVDSLITDWQSNHTNARNDASLKQLLSDRLDKYQLSPTDLNSFLDLHYGGPEQLLLYRLIAFPGSSNLDAEFGNLMHSTLRYMQIQLTNNGQLPSTESVNDNFNDRLNHLSLDEYEKAILRERGETSLSAYIDDRQSMFRPTDRAEVSFKHENVRVGKAHLTGAIDRLEIDEENRQIVVVDYKTGRLNTEKRYKYTRQLYFYKLLIEGSKKYRGYNVPSGRLEFVEADSQTGELPGPLEVTFDDKTMERVQKLIDIVWNKIINLELPDVSQYPISLTGSKAFEEDLLAESD